MLEEGVAAPAERNPKPSTACIGTSVSQVETKWGFSASCPLLLSSEAFILRKVT